MLFRSGPVTRPALDPESLLEQDLPKQRRWPWVFGSLIALAILAAQVLIHFRVELAVTLPETKPALLALCDMAGCDVPLPARVEFVGIETSGLHPDPAAAGHFLLAAELRNRAPFDQRWPYLELTLTDAIDQALVRRTLAPADYLSGDKAGQGFPAQSQESIRLAVSAPGTAAVGYRLYVFYP